MTFLELAEKVLHEEQRQLSSEELWKIAQNKGYADQVGSRGKTPWNSIGAQLYVNIRDNPNSIFIIASRRPTRFILKEFANTVSIATGEPPIPAIIGYKERDLHPFLSYFLYTYKSIYTKTIYHENSYKGSYAQWLHPDMVGVYFSLDQWEPDVIGVAREVGSLVLKLFSYELKRELTFNNLRESFFQAVSNSSWAHQGYLVAAEIAQDSEFLDELKRLSSSFGIGVIQINVQNPDDAEILYPAKEKEIVDIDTMNRLAQVNPDFRGFLKGIKIDISSGEIRKERYDPVRTPEDLRSIVHRNGANNE
ncbi:MAG: HTH domain-containing protein [Rectinema sp.]